MGIVCSGEPRHDQVEVGARAAHSGQDFRHQRERRLLLAGPQASRARSGNLCCLRSGLAGAGAVRTLARVISFPFTLLYLLLYATTVHAREPCAEVDPMKAIQVRRTRRSREAGAGGRPDAPARSRSRRWCASPPAASISSTSISASDCTRPTCRSRSAAKAAGMVEAVGPEVTEVAPGDRVAYAMARGSYAEYAVVPAGHAGEDSGPCRFCRPPRPPCCRA